MEMEMEMARAKQERSNSNWEGMLKRWSVEQGTRRPFPSSPNEYNHPALSVGTDRPAPQWRGEAQKIFMEHEPPKYYDVPDRVYDIACSFTLLEEEDDIVNDTLFYKLKCEDEEDEEDEDEDTEVEEGLLDELKEYAEFTDVASVLHLDGFLFTFLHDALLNKHAAIRAKIAELITTMVQNYPTSQQLLIEEKCLQLLLNNFTSDPDETSRTKTLGAISALIPNNNSGIPQREKGYVSLSEALVSGSFCQREVLKLIKNLLRENNFYSEEMHMSQALKVAKVQKAVLSTALRVLGVQLVENDDKLKQVLQELPSAALPTVKKRKVKKKQFKLEKNESSIDSLGLGPPSAATHTHQGNSNSTSDGQSNPSVSLS